MFDCEAAKLNEDKPDPCEVKRNEGMLEDCSMGLLTWLFGSDCDKPTAKRVGLTNTTSNMKDPIGREECLRLCSVYDNWGGCKIPSPARTFRLTGPGMVLYQIYKEQGGRYLRRGVIFSVTSDYEYKAWIFEWFDFGDGGCPTFNVRNELVHVEGDLFRTKESFRVYEKENTSAIGELNWNTSSDEFAYREIYINNKQDEATK